MLPFLPLPACSDTESEIDTDPQKERERERKHPPTHLSIPFTSHCDALWVMLELEHGTENLWMSLYTYMDDEDAF